ncbi:MAG TPA: hypothetical protein VMT67_06125 [Terriglobales bacterium]|nr:hypothetical protein [Terriglobales bacterium]
MTSAAKAADLNELLTAALKRCATQRLAQAYVPESLRAERRGRRYNCRRDSGATVVATNT